MLPKRVHLPFRIPWDPPLVWLQVTCQGGQFLMASLGVTAAVLLMFVQLGCLAALDASNTILHQSVRGDLIMLHTNAEAFIYADTFSRYRLYSLLSLDSVVSINPVYSDTFTFRNTNSGVTQVITFFGINPEKQPFDFPELDRSIETIKLTNTALFDQKSRPEYGITRQGFQQGNLPPVEVNGQRLRVGGVIDFIGISFSVRGAMIVSASTFQRLMPNPQASDQIRMGLITLDPDADPVLIRDQIQPLLPADVKVITRDQFIQQEIDYWREKTVIGFLFQSGAAVGFLIGLYIVYQVLFKDVSDHIPDYALLKAKGYQDRYLLGLVIQEACVLSVLSYTPSYIGATLFYRFITTSAGLPMYMTYNRAILVFTLTLCMSLLAGVLVTQKLKESDPADLF